MEPLMCKAVIGHAGVEFESVDTRGRTISQMIENDKKYGKMVPANGKYFTWAVLNEDVEFNHKQTEDAFKFAFRRFKIYGKFPKFKKVSKDYKGIIDFRIEYRTPETDPDGHLNNHTVMYAYYPIQKVDHPLRGLIVINANFFFTSHGNRVSGHEYIKFGIRVQFPDGHYESLDADAILGHEFGHATGLDHDDQEGNMMSSSVDRMSEYPSARDQARIMAKQGARIMSAWLLMRWLKWLRVASER